jgi:hypothetical protein
VTACQPSAPLAPARIEAPTRAFFEQLADDAGFPLAWQRLDTDRNIAASFTIMRGDPEPMRKMLDELAQER